MTDAEIIIVAKHLGDLLGSSDQRSGVAVGPREFCNFRPQTFVDPGALLGQREQAARPGGRVAVGRLAVAGLVLQRGRARQNFLGLGPRLFLGVGQDRPDRQKRGAGRPCFAAAARTRAVTSRTRA